TTGCWDVFLCLTDNPPVEANWRNLYVGINRANAVIDNVPGVPDMDPAQQARIVAEASFLRALHYFNLVRIYGGVPLMDQETTRLADLEKSRSTADEIYDFIIADLLAAQQGLPATVPAAEFG